MGRFDRPSPVPQPDLSPFLEDDRVDARWLTIPFLGEYRARAVLGLPKHRQPPYPLVVAQHGIGSSPERVFGFDDPSDVYHAYGRRLVEAGYAVVAPMNVTEIKRARCLSSLCLMLAAALGPGVARTRSFDYCARSDIDLGRTRHVGISWAAATPCHPALSRAWGVGIVTACSTTGAQDGD